MKEKLLNLLEKRKFTKEELVNLYSSSVVRILDELVLNGEVIFYKNHYATSTFFNIYLAKISAVKDHFAFATIDDVDVYISKNNLNGAFLDDLVYIRQINDAYDDRYEVLEVVKRNRTTFFVKRLILKPPFFI